MRKNYVVPKPGMIITEDVSFLPGVYNFFNKEGITIAGNNLTIEGNGAVFIGGKMKTKVSEDTNKEEFGYGYAKDMKDDSLGYKGIGFYSKGTKNVTIKNLNAKNFEIGLKLEDCINWDIRDNDFSYNYHNPDHGWDEHEDLGGIILYYTDECKVENNRANNVWSALVIRNGNRNSVKNNNFSHTSNVGLRLWRSCENEFYNNDFSWGLRKEPFEVHARDSACVLIETGSNNNRFIKNDMRFGGDGLFIRSLNGWMSTGNYFEENDTSFANNNAIEAWDEGNTYVRNKANFSSYGFWLGCSDNTLLLENEVCYNGVNFKNAPENFGNAGISVVNGSGTNFRVIRNKIHNNNGPGMAIRNRVDYPSINWIIEENEIYDNKTDSRGFTGHGIYLKYAKSINLVNNNIYGNDGEDVFMDEFTSDVRKFNRSGEARDIRAHIKVDSRTFVSNKEYNFEGVINIDSDSLEYKWDFSDGETFSTREVKRSFEKGGFYRVILTVTDGENVNYDYANLYVLAEGPEIGTDAELTEWLLTADIETKLDLDTINYVSGESSLLLETKRGKDITLKYPRERRLGLDASGYTHFSFCLRYLNEIIDWYKDNKTPVIRFLKDKENYVEFIPKPSLFSELANKYNESKYEWAYVEMDLSSDVHFDKNTVGEFDFREINNLEIYIDSNLESHIIIVIDGMKFLSKRSESYANIAEISRYLRDVNKKEKVVVSSSHERSNNLSPLLKKLYFGDVTERWISSEDVGEEFYQVDFGTTRQFDRIKVDFYHSSFNTLFSNGEKLPEELHLEYYSKGKWNEIEGGTAEISLSHNHLAFESVRGSKIRIRMNGTQKPFSIYNLEVNNTLNKLTGDNVNSISTQGNTNVDIEGIGIKLNRELNETGSKLSNLVVSLHEYEEDILNAKTLFEREYGIDELVFKKETKLNIGGLKLDTGKKYYLALTQKSLAENMTTGQYFRWVGKGITQMDGSYGYINGSELVTDRVGWGRCWMKIYTDKYIQDLSNTNDTLGNRFGLKNMEKIYQAFELENPLRGLIDASISNSADLKVTGRDTLSLELKHGTLANKLALYFRDYSTAEVEVKIGDRTHKGLIDGTICEIDIEETLKNFEIIIVGKAALRAVEIL